MSMGDAIGLAGLVLSMITTVGVGLGLLMLRAKREQKAEGDTQSLSAELAEHKEAVAREIREHKEHDQQVQAQMSADIRSLHDCCAELHSTAAVLTERSVRDGAELDRLREKLHEWAGLIGKLRAEGVG